MRREIKNIVIVLLSVFISMIMTACSDRVSSGDEPAFTASDLDGNWSLHAISFGLGGEPDGNIKGSLVMDSAGAVTGGSFVASTGKAAPLTGGALAINDTGEINGTVVATVTGFGDLDIMVNNGKVDPSKNIMVWTDTSTDIGSLDMGAAIKQGGTFATSDLEGKWHMFAASVGATIGSPEGTVWGSFELDANGNLVSGDISTSDELDISVVGGAYAMNSAGEVNGTMTANLGEDFNITVDSGKMDPSKNIMFFVDQTAIGSKDFVAAVKSGGTFSSADLAGKWYLYGVSMGTSLGKVTISGYMEVEADGKVTNGIYNSTGELTGLEPLSAKLVSGELSIDENGVVGGTVVAQIDLGDGAVDTTIPIIAGKMSASKNLSVFVTQDDEDASFVIGIKGN